MAMLEFEKGTEKFKVNMLDTERQNRLIEKLKAIGFNVKVL
jgi:hypothetical protein